MHRGIVRSMLAFSLIAGTTTVLVGCTPPPSHDDVAERFAIELAAGPGEQADWVEVADGLATDALDGNCASDTYRHALGDDPVLRYAWASGCTMYFEDQMSDTQVDAAKGAIVAFVLADIEDESPAATDPEPEPEPSATSAPIVPLAPDDPARVGLDAQFGVVFADDSYKILRDQYCTMTDEALGYAGDLYAKQIRDVTREKFIAYIAEKCGR